MKIDDGDTQAIVNSITLVTSGLLLDCVLPEEACAFK